MKELIGFIELLEGKELMPYKDEANLWTIGVGHLLRKSELTSGKLWIGNEVIRWRDGITNDQCDKLLMQDLRPSMAVVNNYVTVPTAVEERHALVSFAFNIGSKAFKDSTLLRVLNTGDKLEVVIQFTRWIYADGHISGGLLKRRRKEMRLWLKKVY